MVKPVRALPEKRHAGAHRDHDVALLAQALDHALGQSAPRPRTRATAPRAPRVADGHAGSAGSADFQLGDVEPVGRVSSWPIQCDRARAFGSASIQ